MLNRKKCVVVGMVFLGRDFVVVVVEMEVEDVEMVEKPVVRLF